MFYFKKAEKEFPSVDLTKEHSTAELHVMRTGEIVVCADCQKKFVDGDKCYIENFKGRMIVRHEECKN